MIQHAHKGPVCAVTLIDDEKIMTAGGDGLIKIGSINDGKLLQTINAFDRPILELNLTRPGPRLVATDGNTLKYWYHGPPENRPQMKSTRQPPAREHLNALQNWKETRGEWQASKRKLIGPQDSRMEYEVPLPNDFTFRCKCKVIGDARPRIRFGNFLVGDDSKNRVLFMHGLKAEGKPFEHQRNQQTALEVRIRGDVAQLLVNGKLTATGLRVWPKFLAGLSFCGGGGWPVEIPLLAVFEGGQGGEGLGVGFVPAAAAAF